MMEVIALPMKEASRRILAMFCKKHGIEHHQRHGVKILREKIDEWAMSQHKTRRRQIVSPDEAEKAFKILRLNNTELAERLWGCLKCRELELIELDQSNGR